MWELAWLPQFGSRSLIITAQKERIRYMNGAIKVNEELKNLAKTVDGEYRAQALMQYMLVTDYIKAKSEEDPLFNAKVMQPHKTLERLWKFLMEKAKPLAMGGITGVADQTMLGWIEEYYLLDDLAEIEEEERKAKEAKEKAEEAKKKKTAKKTSKSKTTKKKKTAEEEPETAENTDAATKTEKVEEKAEVKEEIKVPDEHLKENVETPELAEDSDGQATLFNLM